MNFVLESVNAYFIRDSFTRADVSGSNKSNRVRRLLSWKSHVPNA